MNRHEIRHTFSPQSAVPSGGKLIVALATIIFWTMLLALLSCPAWLPGLIEHTVGR
jgi:hypothetical protein